MAGVTLLGIAVGGVADAQDGGSAYVVGIGALTCDEWLGDPTAGDAGPAWVLGYFSGANTSRAIQVGSSSSGPEIVAEARTLCAASPSSTLWDVVSHLYLEFAKREGRL